MPLSRPLGLLCLTSVVLAACPPPPPPPCCEPIDGGTPGELAIEWLDRSGGLHLDRAAQYDFGAALEADALSGQLRVKNLGPGSLELTSVSQLSGSGAFRVDLPASLQLAAGASAELAVFFDPPLITGLASQGFAARFQVNATGALDGGGTAHLDLAGRAVDAVFSWAPATLDFGYSSPGTTLPGEIVFSNLTLNPVQLSALGTREGGSTSPLFRVVATDSADLTTLTVPAAVRDPNAPNGLGIAPGIARVGLSYTPVVLGPRAGQLTATTDLPEQPSLSVNLRGVGGGADIDARPVPVLDLGRVAYFPSATPASFAQRSLTVRNVGTRPTPADPRANLKLGQPDGAGGFTRPYWAVRPLAGASLSELCVGVFDVATGSCTNDPPPGSYDPAVGLEAGAGSALSIPVRVIPNGLGVRSFELSLFSNDPDEPVTLLTITANAVTLPPCDVEIRPFSLAFGLIAPPSSKEISVTVRNRLTGPNDVCLLSNLELRSELGTPAGMPPVFSLPGGPLLQLELQPGQSHQFVVRAWPQGPLPATPQPVSAKLAFNLADPVSPARELPLSATIGKTCLTIFPASLDFGTVSTACASPDRIFQIHNNCSADVVIASTEMISAAGEGPGGPNCPGSLPCPEFTVVNGPAPGTRVMAGAAPVTFSLKYRPLNLGSDSGAFRLGVTEEGAPQDYVVLLQGEGDLLGQRTQSFRQSTTVKSDVLLVIDDSSSMAPRHTKLAQSLASVFQYASSNQVDFQLGVTNTELIGPTAAQAGLLHSTDAGVKILRPSTPNLQAALTELLDVGTSGSVESCLDPATRALTFPNITDPAKNAGFLRDEATLSVICLTDARDQAPSAPAVYLNQLLNIKGAQRPGQFTYNVIGPFLPAAPLGCLYDDQNDGVHDFMVAQTRGGKAEICSADWSPALESVFRGAFGYPTEFALNASPDLAFPIEVRIDGVSLPPIDPDPNLMTVIWRYDLASNSIIFDPGYVPEPGKTLTVTYRGLCIP